MKIKEFFSFKKNRYFWVNLLAMVLAVMLIIFLVFKGLDIYTRHGEAIVVPDAKGLTVQQAEKLFRSKDLNFVVSDSTYNRDKKPGIVIDHNPQSGQRVKKGRTIYLTTNTLNVPVQMVPDVADNSSLRQAIARVEASGFKLTKHEMISGEKDWVYGVKYNGRKLEPGDKVPIGSTLTLIVGDGLTIEMFGTDSIPSMQEDFEIDETEQPVVMEESWF